jgi:uncharacterized protein (UPF0276 family)
MIYSEPIGGAGTAGNRDREISGVGIGLRTCHIEHILREEPPIPWFELLADNHLARGGLIPAQVEALGHLSGRVQRIQDLLREPLVVENLSSYLRFTDSDRCETEFLSELTERTGCRLLLDLNNLYVNQINHGEDSQKAFAALPLDSVAEIHLGGYRDMEGWLLDAHSNSVSEPVWRLYESACRRLPDTPVLIEWDNEIPAFEVLQGDLNLFGGDLPAFLNGRGNAGYLVYILPYLPDLAKLEWHWHALYYAAEDPPFDMETFAHAARGDGAARIRFRLASALALLESTYPIHQIWRRHREGEETATVEKEQGDRLVLVREAFSPQVVQTDTATFRLLEGIAADMSLGTLGDEGIDLDALPDLIQTGWITGFDGA